MGINKFFNYANAVKHMEDAEPGSATVDCWRKGEINHVYDLSDEGSAEAVRGFAMSCTDRPWPHSVDFLDPEYSEDERYNKADLLNLPMNDVELVGEWRLMVSGGDAPPIAVILFELEGDKFRVLDHIAEEAKQTTR